MVGWHGSQWEESSQKPVEFFWGLEIGEVTGVGKFDIASTGDVVG